jgi:hypothetical protein
MNLLVTNVPRRISSNAKTLGLQHLGFLDLVATSGPPDRSCAIHSRTDKLLVVQHTFSDGQVTFPANLSRSSSKSYLGIHSVPQRKTSQKTQNYILVAVRT